MGRGGEGRRDDGLRLVVVQAGPAPLTSNNTYQEHQCQLLTLWYQPTSYQGNLAPG